jgi:tryptophanyl-tRNA synthetase
MKRILSGMQPTNRLHLGNYLGALKNWVALQKEFECFYCIVDLHAITMPWDVDKLRQSVLEVAASYIAAGVDPKKSFIFPQSAIRGHSELAWYLQCMTPIGWLNRMTQFKDKAGKNREKASAGLYTYPVLMAADILIYKATHVPVGEDQKQHLELARDIAGAYNNFVEKDFFPLPEPQIFGHATRVMSLRDGSKKMSKSDESEYSRINLTDTADQIAQKIRKAKTDMDFLPDSKEGLEERPEAKNLLTLHAAMSDQELEISIKHFAGKQFSDLKKELVDVAVAKLSPITQKMNELLTDKQQIIDILRKGSDRANEVADAHLKEIRADLGMWSN